MRLLLAILISLLFLYEVESAPIVRGVAPNGTAAGESLSVRIVVENISTLVHEDEISFGNGIRVSSIVKQSFQNRLDRRMLFMQVEIDVDASAAAGDRVVTVAGSSPNTASHFYIRSSPEISFNHFKQINSDLIPLHLLPDNLDDDSRDELAAVYLSPFADGFVDVIHPTENESHRIYSFSEGHLVSTREAVLADQDGDGFQDLSVLNWLQFDVAGGVLVRHRNKGDGTYEIVSDRPSRIGDLFITAGNFDGDRLDDIAVVGYIGEIIVITGNGKQIRVRTIPKNFRGEVHGLVAADVNRDGYDDLTIAVDNEVSGKKEFRIAIANRDGSFQTARRISLPNKEEGPWVYAIADLDNDGKMEFIYTTDRYRSVIVATYFDGVLTPRNSIRVECNAFAVGDLEGDGDADVACVGSDIDQIALFRTTGSNFLPRVTFPAPRFPVSIAIGDWNADQKPDLATGFGKMYFPHLPNERNGLTFFLQN